MTNQIKLANKNFLSSLDISSEELLDILEVAKNIKNKDLTIEQKNKVFAWLRKKGKYNSSFSGNPLDLSEELYSLWIEENSFYLIVRYFSERPKYSSSSSTNTA